jgi:hypothetical protein
MRQCADIHEDIRCVRKLDGSGRHIGNHHGFGERGVKIEWVNYDPGAEKEKAARKILKRTIYHGWIVPEVNAATGETRFHCDQADSDGRLKRLGTYKQQEDALLFWDHKLRRPIFLLPILQSYRVYTEEDFKFDAA